MPPAAYILASIRATDDYEVSVASAHLVRYSVAYHAEGRQSRERRSHAITPNGCCGGSLLLSNRRHAEKAQVLSVKGPAV